jgi:hypothetical protein
VSFASRQRPSNFCVREFWSPNLGRQFGVQNSEAEPGAHCGITTLIAGVR